MEKELWGKKFKVVKNGLDEKEVSAFVNSLLEPNDKLIAKVEQANSLLMSLSDRHDYLVSKLTAPDSPKSTTASPVDDTKLNQLNSAIHAIVEKLDKLNMKIDHRPKPERVTSSEGTQVDAEKLAHLNSLIRLAESTIIEADRHADHIRAEIVGKAQVEANMIIHEAQEKAHAILIQAKHLVEGEIVNMFDHAYQKIMSNVESRGSSGGTQPNQQNISLETSTGTDAREDKYINVDPTDIQYNEDMATAEIKLDTSAYKIVEDVIGEYQEQFKYDDSQQYRDESVSTLSEREDESIDSGYEDSTEHEVYEIEDTVESFDETEVDQEDNEDVEECENADEHEDIDENEGEEEVESSVEDENEEKTSDESDEEAESQDDQPEDPALYQGNIELVIPPPVGLDRVMQLHKDLKHIENVDVLNFGGSVDKGITIKMISHVPAKLLEVISTMDGVENVMDETDAPDDITLPAPSNTDSTVRRIVLLAEE